MGDPSAGDTEGTVCPFAAHIRKAYARDDEAPSARNTSGDMPARVSDERGAQTHRLLRRGIPYGKAAARKIGNPQKEEPKVDRGLLFFAYQTSIVNQFEFVTRSCNDPDFNGEGLGHDFIIGQTSDVRDRTRRMRLSLKDGAREGQPLVAEEEWVIPTGGGYFFAPSIEALKNILAEP
jgi:deferrochelatase/peroxidase EfeB